MFSRKKKLIVKLEQENKLLRKMLKIAVEELVCDDPFGAVSMTDYELKLAWIGRIASDNPADWRRDTCGGCGSYMNKERHKQLYGSWVSSEREGVCHPKSQFVNKGFEACDDYNGKAATTNNIKQEAPTGDPQ